MNENIYKQLKSNVFTDLQNKLSIGHRLIWTATIIFTAILYWGINKVMSQFVEIFVLFDNDDTVTYLSAVQPGSRFTPANQVLEHERPIRLSQEGGAAILSGSVRVSERHFDHAKLKFEYWPDIITQPGLRLTPRPDGVNFVMVAD